MRSTLTFASLATVALALGATLALAGPSAPAADKAELGQPAPAFTLQDLAGKTRNLADFKGKTVVLEWTNPSCPFIEGCYKNGTVKKTVEAMKKMGDGYVYVAINSTARGVTREQVIEQNKKFLETHKLEIPVLIDYEGTVGKLYGPTNTPHMFVIDAEGVLRYHGAFTDDKTGKKTDPTNHVLDALAQIKVGETVAPDYIKPWGCSVKYAKK